MNGMEWVGVPAKMSKMTKTWAHLRTNENFNLLKWARCIYKFEDVRNIALVDVVFVIIAILSRACLVILSIPFVDQCYIFYKLTKNLFICWTKKFPSSYAAKWLFQSNKTRPMWFLYHELSEKPSHLDQSGNGIINGKVYNVVHSKIEQKKALKAAIIGEK